MSTRQDAFYMARAIHLAKRGRYTTDTNPRVGCILVRDDVVIGEGWHVKAGSGHAEIEALKNVPDAEERNLFRRRTFLIPGQHPH